MKLIRWGKKTEEMPGLMDSRGIARDLSGMVSDISPDWLAPDKLEWLATRDPEGLPPVPPNARIGVPLAGISKIVCVGLNYADHAAEAKLEIPKEPILFLKAPSALNGPDDDIVIPRGSLKTDWEVELGVVIGTRASYVSERRALDHVAGFCIINDVSEREYQIERGGQWDKGKCCDTFAPVGPWLVTKDEINDPQNLNLLTQVNGSIRQRGSTKTMIFNVTQLVSYISQFMMLEPGDLIATGTPPGVGLGMKPPTYLKPGDRLRLSIHGLGEQNNRTVKWSA